MNRQQSHNPQQRANGPAPGPNGRPIPAVAMRPPNQAGPSLKPVQQVPYKLNPLPPPPRGYAASNDSFDGTGLDENGDPIPAVVGFMNAKGLKRNFDEAYVFRCAL